MRAAWGLSFVGLSFLRLLVACSNAGGSVKGGDVTFDAAVPPGPACSIEAGVDGADAAPSWNGLYADYFGPTGAASCAREPGNCHGHTADDGFGGSGFVCGAEGGVEGCRQSLFGNSRLIQPIDPMEPEKSGLILVLRRHKPDGGPVVGQMPKRPVSCIFEQNAIDRITAWIDAGAPAN